MASFCMWMRVIHAMSSMLIFSFQSTLKVKCELSTKMPKGRGVLKLYNVGLERQVQEH